MFIQKNYVTMHPQVVPEKKKKIYIYIYIYGIWCYKTEGTDK